MEKIKELVSRYRLPAALFLVALAPRLLYVLFMNPNNISPDGFDWIQIAHRIAEGKGYGDNWRSPVYSYFLAGIFLINGKNLLLVRIAQAIVGACTCLSTYYIGKKIFNKRAGVFAGLILAFYPYLIYYCGDILKEVVFTFLLTLMVAALLISQEKQGIRYKIIAGLMAGLAVLSKSTVLPFVGLASLWYIFCFPRRFSAGKVKDFALIMFVMALTIIPWTCRNYFHYHRFVLVETDGARHFWQANNQFSILLEEIPHLSVNRLPDEYAIWYDTRAYQQIINTLSPAEADKTFYREGLAFITGHKLEYMRLLGKRLVHFWRFYPIVATKTNKIIALLTSGWIIPLGFLGMVLSWHAYWRTTSLLILLIFSFTATHMIFWAMIRYRVPIDPFVIVFAGFSIDTLLNKFSHT